MQVLAIRAQALHWKLAQLLLPRLPTQEQSKAVPIQLELLELAGFRVTVCV